MSRADHDRDVLSAFGFRVLSKAGTCEAHVLECRDAAQAADVRASLTSAHVHLSNEGNPPNGCVVIAYVHTDRPVAGTWKGRD